MRGLSLVILGLSIVACVGTARAQDDYAKKIVGVWEVTKSSGDLPVGSTVEFTKDSKLIAMVKSEGGSDMKIDATYKLAKDKLTITVKVGDQSFEEVATIKKLTDDVLETEDKDKKIDSFKKKK